MVMSEDDFKICAECANKKHRDALAEGLYFCPFMLGVLRNGIVSFDTDATECVRTGRFCPIKSITGK